MPLLLNRRRRSSLLPLSAPRQNTFIISAILAVLAIVGVFVVIPVVSPNAFWFLAAAYLLLVVSILTKGF